jgi:hypothetical protein
VRHLCLGVTAGKQAGVLTIALACLRWLIKLETVVVLSEFQIVSLRQILNIRNFSSFRCYSKRQSTIQKTHSVSITVVSLLILLRKVIDGYDFHVKRANTLCEKNAKFVTTSQITT